MPSEPVIKSYYSNDAENEVEEDRIVEKSVKKEMQEELSVDERQAFIVGLITIIVFVVIGIIILILVLTKNHPDNNLASPSSTEQTQNQTQTQEENTNVLGNQTTEPSLDTNTTQTENQTTGQTYTVESGDTLYSIGKKFKVDYQKIIDLNGVDKTQTLHPGQILEIPGGGMKKKIKIALITILIIGVGVFIYFYLPPMLADTVYPLEYKDLIIKYSNQFGLNPNYVAGVIYTESHFNPNATSPVGARGLMQIMPQTGAGIAKQLGESYNANNLYDPETNIRYGCKYLSGLLEKYTHNPNLPLVAYNAGVSLADRFAATGSDVGAQHFYYVIKVRNAEQTYNQLYDEWWKTPTQESKKPTLTDLILSWILNRS